MKTFLTDEPATFTLRRPMAPTMCAKLRPLLHVCAFAAASLLGACSIGPSYVRPTAAVPAAYKEGATQAHIPGWTIAQPNDGLLRGPWWHLFGDPQLNTLEDRVNVSNQSIQKAVALLRQARAMVAYAHAGYSPIVGANVNASRTHYSKEVIDRASSGHTIPDYAVSLDAAWEPDLWGKIGHTVDAARANAQASAADLEGVRLSMHAELAVDYFNLRSLDASKKLLDETIVAYQQALDMTNHRFEAGIVSQSDVAQAETQLETTQAQAIDLGVTRAQYEHAIATLVGEPAPTFSLPPADASFTAPVIPAGLPSQLLERRPDIAAAERHMAAANAQIGIAEAAMYPDLVLSATGGLESSVLGNLLSAPARMWTIGPALIGTLFDGGARHALTASATAQFDASVADYRQTVLTAFQEVEDDLAALRILQQEAAKQNEAVKSANQVLQLQLNQYRIGSVGYLDVVTAQSTALTNERTAVDLQRRQIVASTMLVKALGGAWNVSSLASEDAPTGKPMPQTREQVATYRRNP
jgi:NodT family efflux transporter outer membrane factor (OMF) lipoprotein